MRPEAKTLAIAAATSTSATSANIVVTDINVEGHDAIHIGALNFNGTATAASGKSMSIKVEARDTTNDSYTTIIDGTEYAKEIPTAAGQTTPIDVDVSANVTKGAKLLKITLNGTLAKADATYDLVVLGLAPRKLPASDLQV